MSQHVAELRARRHVLAEEVKDEFHEAIAVKKTEDEIAQTPTEQLRAATSSLEVDIADVRQTLADLEAKVLATEARAMHAICSRRDDDAKAYLMELHGYFEKIEAARGELTALSEVLDTCHAFAKQPSTKTSPGLNA